MLRMRCSTGTAAAGSGSTPKRSSGSGSPGRIGSAGASTIVSTVADSHPKQIDECRDDAESGEDPGQPRARVKQLVETVAGTESEPDGDREHPPDRRRFEQLLVVAAFIVRHERS